MQVMEVSIADIFIPRSERQRRKFTTEDLEDSFKKRGQLQPIIVRKPQPEDGPVELPWVLSAGERRLTAAKAIGWTTIHAVNKQDLPWIESKIVELEENVRRKQLEWQDEARSIAELHDLHVNLNPEWTQSATAHLLGIAPPQLSIVLRVAKELGNPKVAGVDSLRTAYNMLSRADDRKVADALNDIITANVDIFAGEAAQQNNDLQPIISPNDLLAPNPSPSLGSEKKPTPSPLSGGSAGSSAGKPEVPRVIPAERSVLHEDFLLWAPKYRGQPFNFIHCDFPYGVNVFGGTQAGGAKHEEYNDQGSSYWALLKCLCENLDRILTPSGHIMFWFSMEYYTLTMERFRAWAPSLTFSAFPLIWMKSDNVGILPDPKRGPRRIYETALMASREDRLIVKSVSNAYAAPTDKAHHPSTKPEPMLKHFFQMFVDENTRLLDPTCGGGSALRAAEALGAGTVLGLEMSETYYNNAVSALRTFRTLRAVKK